MRTKGFDESAISIAGIDDAVISTEGLEDPATFTDIFDDLVIWIKGLADSTMLIADCWDFKDEEVVLVRSVPEDLVSTLSFFTAAAFINLSILFKLFFYLWKLKCTKFLGSPG